MKITYKFVTGETIKVEADEITGGFILESRRKEHADNERHRYHTAYSIDNDEYEDRGETAVDDDPFLLLSTAEESKMLNAALDQLTKVQRRRLLKLAAGMTISDISRSENAAFNSIKESVETARKKIKKYILKHPQ